MPDIMHLFKFAVPREQAYQAIATADGVRKWWTSDADLEAFAGGQGEFRFYGGQSVHKVTVVESVPPERMRGMCASHFGKSGSEQPLSLPCAQTTTVPNCCLPIEDS